MAIERTLSIIKPDATRRNLTGQINARFEEAGLRIVAQRRVRLTLEQAQGFYAVHSERAFFDDLCGFMISGPVVVQVLLRTGPTQSRSFAFSRRGRAFAAFTRTTTVTTAVVRATTRRAFDLAFPSGVERALSEAVRRWLDASGTRVLAMLRWQHGHAFNLMHRMRRGLRALKGHWIYRNGVYNVTARWQRRAVLRQCFFVFESRLYAKLQTSTPRHGWRAGYSGPAEF